MRTSFDFATTLGGVPVECRANCDVTRNGIDIDSVMLIALETDAGAWHTLPTPITLADDRLLEEADEKAWHSLRDERDDYRANRGY